MSHYFDPAPVVPSRPGRVQLALPDLRVELGVDRGVFSASGIDPGTMELLRASAPGGPSAGPATGPDAGGDLLDLGCGYGAIAVALAYRHPGATVWAVDVNERAVELTAANAAALGLEKVRAVAPDAVPADVRFAEIWSNPPIRVGKAALHELLSQWLPRLADGGTAWLVVQRNLGADSLADWLRHGGYDVVRVGSRKGYRLLRVTRPGDRP